MVNKKIAQIIGNNIMQLRMEKGLFQKELAVLCGYDNENTGRYTICRIEKGVSSPPADKIINIANVLEVPMIELFRGVPGLDENKNKLITIDKFLSENEIEMLNRYRALDEIRQNKVIDYMTDISGVMISKQDDENDKILDEISNLLAARKTIKE